jgi:hypothetical protein
MRQFIVTRLVTVTDGPANITRAAKAQSPVGSGILSLPQIKFERIDGVILRGTV